jgi:hypothetical protein
MAPAYSHAPASSSAPPLRTLAPASDALATSGIAQSPVPVPSAVDVSINSIVPARPLAPPAGPVAGYGLALSGGSASFGDSVLRELGSQPGGPSSPKGPSTSPPPAQAPLPGAPPDGAGALVAAGSSSGFSFACAALLGLLALMLPRLVRRFRLDSELGRPAPFVLLPADPG